MAIIDIVGRAMKGSITAVDASGRYSMSDSSTARDPRIELPLKPKPSSKASSVIRCIRAARRH